MTDSRPTPPVAARRAHVRTHHGDRFEDPYEWLRAKEDAEVIAHLEAENAYTDARTAHLAPLRETLFQEVKSRVLETDLSVPTRDGDWWYYGRTEEGAQYGIQCRTAAGVDDWTPPVLEPGVAVPGEVVLLDGNLEAEGHEFFSLGAFDVSDDGRMLLWSTDFDGSELYTVHVRDLSTGERLADELVGTAQAFFTPDATAVLYTTRDDAWRSDALWLHRLGTAQSDDVRLFHEPDERFWLGAGITRSRRYLVIGVGSKITSEELLLDLSDLTAPPRVVWPRRDGIEYSVDHAIVDGEDRLLILHNEDALDFELVSVSASDPQGERRVILPHTPEGVCWKWTASGTSRQSSIDSKDSSVWGFSTTPATWSRKSPSMSRCTRPA